MKFRKKPVVIEARQLLNEDPSLWEWLGDAYAGHSESEGMTIDINIKTLEGVMTARHRDWIIKGVKGEFYPCKPDIFELTYELAEPVVK